MMFIVWHRTGFNFSVYQGSTDYFEYAVLLCREAYKRGQISGWQIQRSGDGIVLAQNKGITS